MNSCSVLLDGLTALKQNTVSEFEVERLVKNFVKNFKFFTAVRNTSCLCECWKKKER